MLDMEVSMIHTVTHHTDTTLRTVMTPTGIGTTATQAHTDPIITAHRHLQGMHHKIPLSILILMVLIQIVR